MFVDNSFLVEILARLKPASVHRIESLCVLLFKTYFQALQSLLSIGKFFKTIYSCVHTQLGMLINARNFTLSMLDNKSKDLVNTLLTTWNSPRKSFTLCETSLLLGLVLNIDLTTQWVKNNFIDL